MAALAELSPALLAHGGVGGAIVELALTLGVAALFAAVWLRERRAKREEEQDEDQIKPQ